MKYLRAMFPALVLIFALVTAIQEPASGPAIKSLPRNFHPVRRLAVACEQLLNSIARGFIGAAESIAEHRFHFMPDRFQTWSSSSEGASKADSVAKHRAARNSANQEHINCDSIATDPKSAQAAENLKTTVATAKPLSDRLTTDRCFAQAESARTVANSRRKDRKFKLCFGQSGF